MGSKSKIEAVANFLMKIWTHMNISLNMKVKIIVLIK